jgi:hypothetical protein
VKEVAEPAAEVPKVSPGADDVTVSAPAVPTKFVPVKVKVTVAVEAN